MPETIDGLPTHPLVVHLPVVLGPLVGLLAVLLLVPGLRTRLLVPAAVLGVVFAVSTALAVESGETLADTLGYDDSIEAHEDAAELLRTLAFLLAGALAALAIIGTRLPRTLSGVAFVLVALLGAATVAQTIKTGHAGAEHVWGRTAGIAIPMPGPR